MQHNAPKFYQTCAIIGLCLGLAACAKYKSQTVSPPLVVSSAPVPIHHAIENFEESNPLPQFRPAGGAPASAFSVERVSNNPYEGNWALQFSNTQDGDLDATLDKAGDLRNCDVVTCQASAALPRGQSITAQTYIVDEDGRRAAGDSFPLVARWQAISLDLHLASDAGVDIGRIAHIGLTLRRSRVDHAVLIQTDAWQAFAAAKSYLGQRDGQQGEFYVQRLGTRLFVGQVGKFEMTFADRADGPWLRLTQGSVERECIGAPSTGIMLLDQDQFDALTIRQSDTSVEPAVTTLARLKPWGSGPDCLYTWNVVWTSPVAALVEVTQTSDSLDQSGRPGLVVVWRFMIYRTGQVYTHVSWRQDPASTVPKPVSWALSVSDAAVSNVHNAPANLLKALYSDVPAGALPHVFQTGFPVGMITKVSRAESNVFWGAKVTVAEANAAGQSLRLFGAGIPTRNRTGPLDALLLVNSPTLLEIAGESSQYLAMATPQVATGTLDATFPGDSDNDGFVDSTGFYAIRLNNHHAILDLDPGNRPLFYPAFLITDPDHTATAPHLVITIDGQQIPQPVRWPDGSYLVELPYVINKPVHIEVSPE